MKCLYSSTFCFFISLLYFLFHPFGFKLHRSFKFRISFFFLSTNLPSLLYFLLILCSLLSLPPFPRIYSLFDYKLFYPPCFLFTFNVSYFFLFLSDRISIFLFTFPLIFIFSWYSFYVIFSSIFLVLFLLLSLAPCNLYSTAIHFFFSCPLFFLLQISFCVVCFILS